MKRIKEVKSNTFKKALTTRNIEVDAGHHILSLSTLKQCAHVDSTTEGFGLKYYNNKYEAIVKSIVQNEYYYNLATRILGDQPTQNMTLKNL